MKRMSASKASKSTVLFKKRSAGVPNLFKSFWEPSPPHADLRILLGKEIKKSPKMIEELEVPFGNIRFARMVLRDVRSEELNKKGPVFVALRSIHIFLLEFIRAYVQKVRETGKGGGNICNI